MAISVRLHALFLMKLHVVRKVCHVYKYKCALLAV
jgi:hypothetical protein